MSELKDKYIGLDGKHFQAYWAIHGCPMGHQTNIGVGQGILQFHSYINFHRGPAQTHIDFPSKPGEKFIKDFLPELNGFAYTYVRTGIYETTSSRSGSNYGAITIFMDDMSDENWKKFQPKLKEWFKENILDQFTVGNTSNTDDWLRWNKEAQLSLFQGRKYDEKLHKSICNFLQPYLDVMYSQKTNNNTKTDDLENGIKELNKKISKLKEERKKLIYEQKKLKQQTNNNTF